MSDRCGSSWKGTTTWVEEILDQWYGPDDGYFNVPADDGNLCIFRQQTSRLEGNWDLVSFRDIGRGP
jgi:hypothetical protein